MGDAARRHDRRLLPKRWEGVSEEGVMELGLAVEYRNVEG